MRGAVVLVLVGAACRPLPPEPLVHAEEIEHDEPRPVVLAEPVLLPRPDIDIAALVPDPTHELRWPLSIARHPELEPQFEIARALAEPGVGWLDLCRMGAHNRHLGKDKRDHVAYLRAWCSVGKQDLDGALANLVPLTGSVVLGLAAAVRADFANIVISSGDADDATRLLTKHGIKDVNVLDAIAASYVELGRLDDAYDINELALANDDRKNHANRCRRLTRRIVLRPPSTALRSVDLAHQDLFDVPTNTDVTCSRLERELLCWLNPVVDCNGYHFDQKLDVSKAGAMLAAYFAWPEHSGSAVSWPRLWRIATTALPYPGADRLAVAALWNDLRSTTCTTSFAIAEIVQHARRLQFEPHDPSLDALLARILGEPQQLCLAR